MLHGSFGSGEKLWGLVVKSYADLVMVGILYSGEAIGLADQSD
jgi:hypothetical protein